MRVCQECGKKCRKKFRIRKGYMGKDRYHKLLVINKDRIVVSFIVLCQECMRWTEERTFCGLCLDIDPICGFYDRDKYKEKYVGVCNDCIEELKKKDDYHEIYLDIEIMGIFVKYRICDLCSRICNGEIITKEDIKNKNKLHSISEYSTTGKHRYTYICERCFGWKKRANIYCSVCGTRKGRFVNDSYYPSICIKCKEEKEYTNRIILTYMNTSYNG